MPNDDDKLTKMQETPIRVETEFLAVKERLQSYLYRLTTNKEDTEDLVQDTYLRVKEKIGTFRGDSSFQTWVFAIATNLAKDNQRVKDRWRLDAQDECKNAALTEPRNQQRIVGAFRNQTEKKFEIVEHINYCFTCIAKNLPLEQQIAVILKECYQFKRAEIAKIMRSTEGVVKHLLHHGRKKLQTKYEHRCAMVNKNGVCYQCAELNDFLQAEPNSKTKINRLGLSRTNDPERNLDIRFQLIHKINPLNSNGAELEDTILQILRETTQES